MIDEPGNIVASATIKVETLIEIENRDTAVAAPALTSQTLDFAAARLRLCDALAPIFHYARTVRDCSQGIHSPAVDFRIAGSDARALNRTVSGRRRVSRSDGRRHVCPKFNITRSPVKNMSRLPTDRTRAAGGARATGVFVL
jgi:hypothetical protein